MSEEMKLSDEQIDALQDRLGVIDILPDGVNGLHRINIGQLCAQAKLANAPAHADEPVAWLYTTSVNINGRSHKVTLDNCYSHGSQRPDERAGWIPLFAHPSAGIRSEVIEEPTEEMVERIRHQPNVSAALDAYATAIKRWGKEDNTPVPAMRTEAAAILAILRAYVRALGESS